MVNGDELVTLRHYIETLFAQYEKHHSREHELMEESLEHSRKALETRLEGMNEFRAQITGERTHMVSLDRFNAVTGMLESRVGSNEKQLSNLIGRMAATAAAVTVGLLIVGLVLRFVV